MTEKIYKRKWQSYFFLELYENEKNKQFWIIHRCETLSNQLTKTTIYLFIIYLTSVNILCVCACLNKIWTKQRKCGEEIKKINNTSTCHTFCHLSRCEYRTRAYHRRRRVSYTFHKSHKKLCCLVNVLKLKWCVCTYV